MRNTRKFGCGCDCSCGCCEGSGCGCQCDSGCSSGGGFRRRYQTREEQIAELSDYLKDLKAEVQAVQERLAELKGKK